MSSSSPGHQQDRHLLKLHGDLRPRRNRRHFADDIFKCIFFNENLWISIKVPLKFDLKSPINNNPALVQIMVWCRPGDKPLSEPMLIILLTHICVTRPQWVKLQRLAPTAILSMIVVFNQFLSLLRIINVSYSEITFAQCRSIRNQVRYETTRSWWRHQMEAFLCYWPFEKGILIMLLING